VFHFWNCGKKWVNATPFVFYYYIFLLFVNYYCICVCTVAGTAQWNGAGPYSSSAAAPCSGATLSDLLSADSKMIYDNSCCVDFSKKSTAISVTGETNCRPT